MAYDAAHQRVVMFGGSSGNTDEPYPASLWAWDGDTWKCIAADGPPGRRDAFLEFDGARRELVLFGGRQIVDRSVEYFTDTWAWNGAAWTLRQRSGPGPRIHGATVYDRRMRSVIIHGGGTPEGWRHDTWRWSGTDWREVQLPLPFNGNGNSIISEDDTMTMLGAERGVASCGELQRARLFHISRNFTVTDAGSPGPCFSQQSPATAFAGGIVLFAGWNGPEAPAESWTWSHGRWERTATAPTRRRGAAAAYDPVRQRVVLFGGTDERGLLGDTWQFDGTNWSRAR